MGGSAIIGGAMLGSSLLGGVFGSKASKSAAQTAAASGDAATEAQLAMYEQSREDLAPWRKAGTSGLNTLASMLEAGPGEFTASEGYDWRLGQGLQGIQRAASAGGALRSGAHLKAANDYAQNMATEEYDNFLRRWYESLAPYQSLANLGQTTGTQLGANALNTGQMVGQNIMESGQARAAGQMGSANSLIGNLQWGAGNLMDMYQSNALRNAMINRQPSGPASYGYPNEIMRSQAQEYNW